jgi:hypothetical protein
MVLLRKYVVLSMEVIFLNKDGEKVYIFSRTLVSLLGAGVSEMDVYVCGEAA